MKKLSTGKEVTLKSNKKIKLKEITIDEQDELLDSLSYKYDDNGLPVSTNNMHKTTTKWIRIGVEGDVSDEFLKTLSIKDRSEIFIAIQENMKLGE